MGEKDIQDARVKGKLANKFDNEITSKNVCPL